MSPEEERVTAHCMRLVATNLSLTAQVEMMRVALGGKRMLGSIFGAWKREREERLLAEELARSRMEELCLLKQER